MFFWSLLWVSPLVGWELASGAGQLTSVCGSVASLLPTGSCLPLAQYMDLPFTDMTVEWSFVINSANLLKHSGLEEKHSFGTQGA